jgi:hypothetical protein
MKDRWTHSPQSPPIEEGELVNHSYIKNEIPLPLVGEG